MQTQATVSPFALIMPKELKPEIEDLRKTLVSHNVELMKFVHFSQYESQRLMVVVAKYQQAVLENDGTGH